jgi:ubiquinone/menaquinone biosynthesis C-methylase UbiE
MSLEPATEQRYERERHFHDDRFTTEVRGGLTRWYAVMAPSQADYERAVREVSPGDATLELGCGVQSTAFDLARAGARPTAIDISPVAVRVAQERAAQEGVVGATFRVMNAERLELADSSFDNVHGSGVLHHLDLSVTLPELRRVLKPGGRLVFIEPLGHNPAINLFRRLTPSMRTADEHPLLTADLALLRQHFPSARFRYYHLTALLAALLHGTALQAPLLRVLSRLDTALLRLPFLQRFAWVVVIDTGDGA